MTGAEHTCTADCWAYLTLHGQDDNTTDCDPYAAFQAAHEAAHPQGVAS